MVGGVGSLLLQVATVEGYILLQQKLRTAVTMKNNGKCFVRCYGEYMFRFKCATKLVVHIFKL